VTAQRTIDVPWNGWLAIPDIVMDTAPGFADGGAPNGNGCSRSQIGMG
jgi:hypothetical protein